MPVRPWQYILQLHSLPLLKLPTYIHSTPELDFGSIGVELCTNFLMHTVVHITYRVCLHRMVGTDQSAALPRSGVGILSGGGGRQAGAFS